MFVTERLILRKITKDDLPKLIELRSDPEVYKYLGGLRLQNPQALEKRLEYYLECHEKCGFGFCLMDWKETGETIGWSGLQPLEDSSEIEVGYGMIKPFWRRGIGFECAAAWLEYGFEKVKLERIVALADPDNIGSWMIMEKLGMRFEKIEPHFGMNCKFYAISKNEFFNNQTK